MYWGVILLKCIAGGVVGALRDREDKILQQLEVGYTLAFTDFTTKGQKAPRFSPKKQPQTITETPLPFFFSVLCTQFSIFQMV